ncbi:MAG: vWA domain-containing protein [Halanaerobiaceae bacterium]
MNFLNFPAIYFLFLALVIIFFYLLKGKKSQIIFPAIFLWEQVKRESKNPRPRLRLEWEPLLFLQLLILLLFVTALMHPYLSQSGLQEERVVLVIDQSASMQATDVSPNRFTAAKQRAISYLDQLASDVPVSIIGGKSRPRIVASGQNHGEIAAEINDLAVTESKLAVEDTLKLAHNLLERENEGKIVMFSDGNFSPPQNNLLAGLQWEQIGSSGENIAITNMQLAPRSETGEQYQLYVEYSNFSHEERQIPYVIKSEETVYVDDTFSLEGREQEDRVYDLTLEDSTPLTAELVLDDDLSLDNKAYAVGGRDYEFRVLVVGRKNPYLERAFLSLPQIRLFYREEISEEINFSSYDLVVFNQFTPPDDFNNKALYFRAEDDSENEEELDNNNNDSESVYVGPENIYWNRDHPLLNYVDFNSLAIFNYSQSTAGQGQESIVFSSFGPLISAGNEMITFNFALDNSNLSQLPTFPLLLYNSLNWFYPEIEQLTGNMIRVGENYKPVNTARKKARRILDPDNESYLLDSEEQFFTETNKTGNYLVQYSDDTQDYFSVNLFSSQESDLSKTGNNLQQLTEEEQENGDSTGEQRQYLWYYLVLLILLLLLVEWYIFARGGTKL